MAFSNIRTAVSISIQPSTSSSQSSSPRYSRNVVSVTSQAPTSQNIFANTSRLTISSSSGKKRASTKRVQVPRSYYVYRPIPPTSVSDTPPPEVPTPSSVEEQSETSVYTPPPPPPEPKIVTHYGAVSTKDELVIDSLDNVTGFLRDTSVSNLRPELLGSLDWIPGKSNIGHLTTVDQLIDVRWTMRQLLVENVEETIKKLKDNQGDQKEYDQVLQNYETFDLYQRNLMDDAYGIVLSLELAKSALDIKDNEEALSTAVTKFVGEKIPGTTETDTDLSIRSLFVNSLGFSEDGYDKFSNSKIINQILSDLRFAVLRHSPMLISENNYDRQDDEDSLTIDRVVVPRHRGYKLRPFNLRSPKFDPGVYSKYSSFLAALPIDDEDRIKVLVMMLSRELTVSAGLGMLANEGLGKRFGAPNHNSIGNALGIPKNNILEDVKADGSLADYVLINETKNGAARDNRSILPFETRVFVDKRGRRAVPGSIALVDNIIRFGDMFNTDPYVTFAKGFEDTTNDAIDYIEKLLNLEDEEYKLQPQSIFSSVLTGLKNTVDDLTSSTSSDQEQAIYTSILNLSRTDQGLRHLVFRYLLELRDVSDELETDSGEDLTGSKAFAKKKREALEAFRKSQSRSSATGREAAKMGAVTWEEISKNLEIDALKARNLLRTARNPLSYTAMKIAKRVFELAEEFPAGTVPSNTRDVVTLGKEAVYSTLMKASHKISGSNSAIAIIINLVREMEESAAALATRNEGEGVYLAESGKTLYNGWDEDAFFVILFEIFILLFSRHVESYLYRSGQTLYVIYDSAKNKSLIEAIDLVVDMKLSDSEGAQDSQAEEVDSGSDEVAEGTLSQGAALTELSDDGTESFTDLQTFMTELEQETKFIHHMNSVLQAISSTMSTSADQLESFFGNNTGRIKDLGTHSLGKKFLQSLSSQQLLLLNAMRSRMKRRPEDGSYLPATQTISAHEIAALRALLAEPKLGGRTGDNIRVLPVGIPAGLLASLRNPSYTIGSKESTELPEHRNVVEINVYKRDLEYEDVIFKPKKFLYDISLFLMPTAFGDINPDLTTRLEEVYSQAVFSHFMPGTDSRQPEDVDSKDAVEERTSSDITDSGLYEFLGSDGGTSLLSNHIIDRLLRVYYGLLFGLEMDESTFMYDDAWLDIFVDGDAKTLLQLGEANEATSWWVRNGSVPVGNLILSTTLEGETLNKVVTSDDASAWMKERIFSSQAKANKFWSDTENARKYEAGLATQGGKDITHHHHGKWDSKTRRHGEGANDGDVRVDGHHHTHKSRRIASSSTDSIQTPKRWGSSRKFRIPPLLSGNDLNSFRALASATLFNSRGTLLKFMAPKLFDRVFMVPVEPDDFEIDIEATSENFGGNEFLDKDFFSEISEDVQLEDGSIVKKLKPRRKGENYSSFNDFFVTISTPSGDV